MNFKAPLLSPIFGKVLRKNKEKKWDSGLLVLLERYLPLILLDIIYQPKVNPMTKLPLYLNGSRRNLLQTLSLLDLIEFS